MLICGNLQRKLKYVAWQLSPNYKNIYECVTCKGAPKCYLGTLACMKHKKAITLTDHLCSYL